MYRCSLIFVLSLTVFLSGCQLPGGKTSGAKDGYFTWVDEQGQVRQTVIPDKESPTEGAQGKNDDKARPADSTPEAPDSPGRRHSEFNLENYPDGDALAERGYIRPGDPEPYFSWRDDQGRVRVSYYRPDTRTAVEKGDIKPPLEITEASIYQATTTPENPDLPEGADAFAAAVLGLDKGEAPFFERWTSACCDSLERSGYVEWQAGREFGVNLESDSPTHDFITGKSHYRLVRLPPSLQDQQTEGGSPVNDFILRLRSFDQKGLLVPSVAFLDDEFRPLRLVTNLVAEYIPESWSRHGHLRAYIPVFPGRGERWMLIFTTSEDLEGQTVIDTRYGPHAIRHRLTGQLGLVKVED